MANMNRTKVITGINTKLSYFHGWEPVSINGGAEKYSVSVLIPKDDTETVNAVNKAIEEVKVQKLYYNWLAEATHQAAQKNPAIDDNEMTRERDRTKKTTVKMQTPATQPATDPATQPVTDPATQPATDPAAQPATDPATQPATDPAAQPATDPAAQPAG